MYCNKSHASVATDLLLFLLFVTMQQCNVLIALFPRLAKVHFRADMLADSQHICVMKCDLPKHLG